MQGRIWSFDSPTLFKKQNKTKLHHTIWCTPVIPPSGDGGRRIKSCRPGWAIELGPKTKSNTGVLRRGGGNEVGCQGHLPLLQPPQAPLLAGDDSWEVKNGIWDRTIFAGPGSCPPETELVIYSLSTLKRSKTLGRGFRMMILMTKLQGWQHRNFLQSSKVPVTLQ